MDTRGRETQDTENTGLTLLPGGGRSGGLTGHGDRTGQDRRPPGRRPVLGAMAGQGTRVAMAERGARAAMAGQGTREAMADRGAWVSMVDPGTQEAMAERGEWEAMAGQGAREAMADWEARKCGLSAVLGKRGLSAVLGKRRTGNSFIISFCFLFSSTADIAWHVL